MNKKSGPMSGDLRRRWLLLGAAHAAGLALPSFAAAHSSIGPVDPPQHAPELILKGEDGHVLDLRSRLKGCVTALQLMFTGCSATCPIQGAIFADVQARLLDASQRLRLLSVSVDPMSDDPKALRAWLARFGAVPGRWSAASPSVLDQNRLPEFLRGRKGSADQHATQVFLFNKRAEMVFRTPELPPSAHLAQLILDLDRMQ